MQSCDLIKKLSTITLSVTKDKFQKIFLTINVTKRL